MHLLCFSYGRSAQWASSMTMCQTQMDSRQRELKSTPKSTPEGPLKSHEEGSLHPFDIQTRSKRLNSERRNKRLGSRETGVSDTKAPFPPTFHSRCPPDLKFQLKSAKSDMGGAGVAGGWYRDLPSPLEPLEPSRKCLRRLPVCVWPGITHGFAPWECCCAPDCRQTRF